MPEQENARTPHRNRLADFYVKAYLFLTAVFILIGLVGWLL